MEGNQRKQLAWEAACTVVEGRPEMAQASRWLTDEWDNSWSSYMEIILGDVNDNELKKKNMAAYMLLLTMLHRKISNSRVSDNDHPSFEMLSYLSQELSNQYNYFSTLDVSPSAATALIKSLSYCFASTWVYHCRNHPEKEKWLMSALEDLPSLYVTLCVWQCIPDELGNSFPVEKKNESIVKYLLPTTLSLTLHAINTSEFSEDACKVLFQWSSHLTFSQIVKAGLYQPLVALLSSTSTLPTRKWIASTFTEIISNIYRHTDDSIQLLQQECQTLYTALHNIFISLSEDDDEDVKYAIAMTCITLLTTEEILEKSTFEWWQFALHNLQLNSQSNIAIHTLDVWLALQDVPVDERPSFLTSILPHVLITLLQRLTMYDDDDEENDFKLNSKDVFISLSHGLTLPVYFDIINNFDGNLDVKLFAVNSISTLIPPKPKRMKDLIFEKISTYILPQILSAQPKRIHLEFIGRYAFLCHTNYDVVFSYVTHVLVNNTNDWLLQLESAKTIQKLCSSHSKKNIDYAMMSSWVQTCLQPPAKDDEIEEWECIAEILIQACTRTIVQQQNKECYQQIILNPLWQYTTATQQHAKVYGKLWEQVIVFTENKEIMQTMLIPMMLKLLDSLAVNDEFTMIWVSLHVQLLPHVSLIPQSQVILNQVIARYTETFQPCYLRYVSSVVELYGSSEHKDLFPPLWTHILSHTCTHISSTGSKNNVDSEVRNTQMFYLNCQLKKDNIFSKTCCGAFSNRYYGQCMALSI